MDHSCVGSMSFIDLYVCFYTSSMLPKRCSGKEPICQFRRCRRPVFDLWVGKIPWRRKWQPASYSCLGNPMDRGAWRPTIHRVTKNRIQLTKYATPCYLDYCSFVEQSELREDGNSQLCYFFLKIALAIWSLLWFHVNFKVIFSGSLENVRGILIRIALSL